MPDRRTQKEKHLQDKLAKMLKTKRPVIGHYKRDKMKPSNEATLNIANFL